MNQEQRKIVTGYLASTTVVGVLGLFVAATVWIFRDKFIAFLMRFSQDGSLEAETIDAIHVFPRVAVFASFVILLPSLLLFLVALKSKDYTVFFQRSGFLIIFERGLCKSKLICLSLMLFFIVFLNIFMYQSCLDDFFAHDDFLYLEGTQDTSQPLERLGQALSNEGIIDNHYRPLSTVLYFSAARALFGLNPSGYHVVNLFFQCLNSLLVFFFIKAVTNKKLYAFLGSLFYSTRGALFVTVFWITDIQDLLLTCFFLLTILSYLRWKSSHRPLFLVLSILCFSGSLLSKESSVTLPVVLFIIDLFLERDGITSMSYFKESFWRIFPFAFVVLLYLLSRHLADIPFGKGPYQILPGFYSVLRLPIYLIWSFIAVYEIRKAFIVVGIVGWFFIGVAILLWIRRRSKNRSEKMRSILEGMKDARHSLVGLLWFSITLAPTLAMPERFCPYYLTLPLCGLSMAIGIFLGKTFYRFSDARAVAFSMLLAIVITFTGLSKTEIFAKSKSWLDTGGYIQGTSSQIAETALEDMKRLFPSLPPNSELYFFNFHKDAMVGGDPLGDGFRSRPTLESMYRVFYGLRSLTVTYVEEKIKPRDFIESYNKKERNSLNAARAFFICFENGHFRDCRDLGGQRIDQRIRNASGS